MSTCNALSVEASKEVCRLGFGRWIEIGEETALKLIFRVGMKYERATCPGQYLIDSLSFLVFMP